MEKFLKSIKEAEKIIKNVDHILYITFPLVKDKKLLLNVLEDIKSAISHCINSILQHEYLYKRITLYQNPKTNFITFIQKSSKYYHITEEETKRIVELFDLVEKHKESPMEFIKDGKIIIMSENLKTKLITIEKIKEFLLLSKSILIKTKKGILS